MRSPRLSFLLISAPVFPPCLGFGGAIKGPGLTGSHDKYRSPCVNWRTLPWSEVVFFSRDSKLQGVVQPQHQEDEERVFGDLEDELEVLEDIERTTLRLSGFEPYVLVSTLISTSSFEAMTNHDFSQYNLDGTPVVDRILGQASLVDSALAALLGLYCTLIFASVSLYGKTAIGLDKDIQYRIFMERTQNQRIRAFQALSAAIVLFSIDIVLFVANQIPEQYAISAMVVGLTVVLVGYLEWNAILKAAEPIFVPDEPRTINEEERIRSVKGLKESYLLERQRENR